MNFEEIKTEARKRNIDILRKEINEKWVCEKIQKHLKRNSFLNYDEEEIRKEISSNDLVASFFIKDPSKQNITEKIIAERIEKIEGINNFVNFSSNVNLFVINGEITDIRYTDIKSIDYYWEFNDKKIYATQKYTKSKGGAQDNQRNDVISFLKHANKNENKDVIFFALLDGEYYTEELKNKLREEFPNVKICGVEELEDYLEQI